MKTRLQYHSRPRRRSALWGLVAALVLLLTVGRAGAVGQECTGRSTLDSGQSAVGSGQSATRHSPFATRHSPFAHQLLADKQPANLQTTPSRTVTYTYDRSGRLTSANYGDGALQVYKYDPAGNMQRVTDRFDTFLPLVVR